MSAQETLRSRAKEDYRFFLEYRTRWSDNDVYGHLNNSIYHFLIDSIVNAYLAETVGKGKPPTDWGQRRLVASSQTNYFGSLAYPHVAELGLRVNHLGSSSARFEVGIFGKGDPAVKAVGELTHVFVDHDTGRPASRGTKESVRMALQKIQVAPAAEETRDNGAREPHDFKPRI